MNRYECVIYPQGGRELRTATVISQEELSKDRLVKIGKTKWVIKVAIPSDTNRPHIGDLVAQTITR